MLSDEIPVAFLARKTLLPSELTLHSVTEYVPLYQVLLARRCALQVPGRQREPVMMMVGVAA